MHLARSLQCLYVFLHLMWPLSCSQGMSKSFMVRFVSTHLHALVKQVSQGSDLSVASLWTDSQGSELTRRVEALTWVYY